MDKLAQITVCHVMSIVVTCWLGDTNIRSAGKVVGLRQVYGDYLVSRLCAVLLHSLAKRCNIVTQQYLDNVL